MSPTEPPPKAMIGVPRVTPAWASCSTMWIKLAQSLAGSPSGTRIGSGLAIPASNPPNSW